MTQKAMICKHLKEHGSITSMEAIQNYGATRLSDIIFKLRNQGWDIDTQMITTKNRYGTTTSYAKYIYKEDKEDE